MAKKHSTLGMAALVAAGAGVAALAAKSRKEHEIEKKEVEKTIDERQKENAPTNKVEEQKKIEAPRKKIVRRKTSEN